MDAIQEQISRLQADIMEIKTAQAVISTNFAHLQQQLMEFATSVKQLKTIVNYTTIFGVLSVGILIGIGALHVHAFSSVLQLLNIAPK